MCIVRLHIVRLHIDDATALVMVIAPAIAPTGLTQLHSKLSRATGSEDDEFNF